MRVGLNRYTELTAGNSLWNVDDEICYESKTFSKEESSHLSYDETARLLDVVTLIFLQ